jgi:hypothetical protein
MSAGIIEIKFQFANGQFQFTDPLRIFSLAQYQKQFFRFMTVHDSFSSPVLFSRCSSSLCPPLSSRPWTKCALLFLPWSQAKLHHYFSILLKSTKLTDEIDLFMIVETIANNRETEKYAQKSITSDKPMHQKISWTMPHTSR